MFVAIRDDNNEPITSAEADRLHRRVKFKCPLCGNEMSIRHREVGPVYFAHSKKTECDTFTHDITSWHYEWMQKFPKETYEKPLTMRITNWEYEEAGRKYGFSKYPVMDTETFRKSHPEKMMTISHIPDILIGNTVVEIQGNKPIAPAEFVERNWFFNTCGKKVVWIVDVEAIYDRRQMRKVGKFSDVKYRYEWMSPIRMFNEFYPQPTRNQGNVQVYLQIKGRHGGEGELIHLLWVAEKVCESRHVKYTLPDWHSFIATDCAGGIEGLLKRLGVPKEA